MTNFVKPVLSGASGNSQSKKLKLIKIKLLVNLLFLPKSKPSKLYFRKISIVDLINFFLRKKKKTINKRKLKNSIRTHLSSSEDVSLRNFSTPALAPPSDNNAFI